MLDVVRIASANILHGIDVRRLSPGMRALPPDAVDLPAVAAWLRSLDADVVVLQEVDHHLERSGDVDQVAWLADALGWEGVFAPALAGDPDRRWEEVPVGGIATGVAGYGVGVLSRVGLDEVVRTRMPYGGAGSREGETGLSMRTDEEPRVALSATVGDGVRVSTTHLSYLFWQAVPQLGRAMEAAARGHRGPGVFLGDVNLPRWGGWLALHAWGLHPWGWPRLARRSAGWTHVAAAPTYPSWSPRLQLDQAFVRHVDVESVSVRVGPAGPSDHLPLVVDLPGH